MQVRRMQPSIQRSALLPCGNRTCAVHIEAMIVKNEEINEDRNMIKCHFCEKIHRFPEDDETGFPVDRNIPLLLNMKHCREHESAKKSFSVFSQLLDNLIKLDKEDYVIDYFGRVEADILLEQEINQKKLTTFYKSQLHQVHAQKVKCLQNLTTNKALERKLNEIKLALIEHENKLKKEKLDFTLKTLDGGKIFKQIATCCARRQTHLAKSSKKTSSAVTRCFCSGQSQVECQSRTYAAISNIESSTREYSATTQ